MNEIYYIKRWQDKEWAIYTKDDDYLMFHGSLEEVNAWLSLEEKGFNLN